MKECNKNKTCLNFLPHYHEIFLLSRRVAQFLPMSSQLLFQGLLLVGIAQTISSAGLGNSPESCDSDGSSYLQKARQQGVLNFMVHQGMDQSSITNIVYRNGYAFATLDNTDPSDSITAGCQTVFLSVPSGWEIAPDDSDSVAVTAEFPWGTAVLVYANGRAVYTFFFFIQRGQ